MRTAERKNAALHFHSYLQSKGLLDAHGSIDRLKLLDIFVNQYQPKFHSHLDRYSLLSALLRAKAIYKKEQVKDNNKIVFKIDRLPQNIPPPESKPKQKVFVNEEYVFKHAPEKQPAFTGNRCHICKEDFNSEEDFGKHLKEEIHVFRELYRNSKHKIGKTVDGIKITFSELENEAVDTDTIQNIIIRENETSKVIIIEIINTKNKTEYTLDNIFKICDLHEVNLHVGELPQPITPGIPLCYNMETHFSTCGAYLYPIVFQFSSINNNDGRKSTHNILREIVFRMQSDLMDSLKPISAYHSPQKKIITILEGPILAGIPLPSKPKGPATVKQRPPKKYEIPQLIMLLLKSKLQPLGENMTKELGAQLQEVKQLLGSGKPYKESLTVQNYAERFHLLLYLEEFKMNVDIRQYDKMGQVMQKHAQSMFFLQVEGLAENRPSVLRGDIIYVCKAGDRSVRYEGIVHEVQEERVLLGIHRDILKTYVDNMKFDIFFSLNRYPIRMYHRALDFIHDHNAPVIYFPEQKFAVNKPAVCQNFKWVNRKIGENPEQQQAVKNIVNNTSSPAPYLIFGPPGTGKTVTVVEAICQIWHLNPLGPPKQLVCAPSNAACDVITKRLLKSLPQGAKLLRLYAMSTSYGKVCQEFISAKIVNLYDRDVYIPSKASVMEYDIVICTTVTAGRLVTIGVPAHHYSYVFVDECGQAIEPEVLIPIGVLTDRKTKMTGQLILVGDPKQLGPILRSRLASEMGLGMSLLERLMEHNTLYQKDAITGRYDSQFLTKLVQNYRSHKSILEVPNKCFYDNELQVRGDINDISKALRWEQLPKLDFPIIFHGIAGKDERESNSPSYFNRQEIDKIVQYLKQLIGEKLSGYTVTQNDIGIITPYRKQVQKFQQICRRLGWKDMKIGCVEEFQGDERLIIIVSTVRSNQNFLEQDYYFNLGFLKNPKRFNVAITRAKALLIVVGNPHVLRCDPHWYALLKFCLDNGAYTGLQFPFGEPPPPPPSFHSLAMDFAAMSLSGEENNPEGGIPWRREQ